MGIQKSIKFDAQDKKVSEPLYRPDMRIPEPGSAKERMLDFVCDYQIKMPAPAKWLGTFILTQSH